MSTHGSGGWAVDFAAGNNVEERVRVHEVELDLAPHRVLRVLTAASGTRSWRYCCEAWLDIVEEGDYGFYVAVDFPPADERRVFYRLTLDFGAERSRFFSDGPSQQNIRRMLSDGP